MVDTRIIDMKDLHDDVIATIDFLRKERNLNEHECLAVLQIMITSFPKEYAVILK